MKSEIVEIEIGTPPYRKLQLHIEEHCFSVRLIAQKIGIEQPYLSNMLKGVLPLSKKVHQKLNAFLNTNY